MRRGITAAVNISFTFDHDDYDDSNDYGDDGDDDDNDGDDDNKGSHPKKTGFFGNFSSRGGGGSSQIPKLL